MNIENKLDKLKKIGQVEVPPFLFTRIKQSIDSVNEAPVSVKWKFVFVTTAIVLLALNIGLLQKSSNTTRTAKVEQVINSMQLSSVNDFYHD
jgi:hypothetical protein